MDHDMADLISAMGGMDMSEGDMFRVGNQALAQLFWYIVAGVVALGLLVRITGMIETSLRRRRCHQTNVDFPSRPSNIFWSWHATMTAVSREMIYPAVSFRIPWLNWLSPPPLGRSLLLTSYWAMILGLLLSKSVILDPYYWERIAFRAAWISVTQVPLVYLLASKNNVIGLFVGLSHERLNWLHRWVSRTLLVTVTIHGAFFLREWTIADFVALELEIMPMVKYGIGAWAILTWTFVSSLTPLRRLSYEFFVLQHLAAAVLLLWILHVHVPAYAQYNIWFAIAVFAVDFAFKGALAIYCNIPRGPRSAILGHSVELVASSSDWTEARITNVNFKWSPGQYVYLWLPFLGPLETHPFTIANAYDSDAHDSNNIQLVVRAHKGFSRRLHKRAAGQASPTGNRTLGFVRGPYGVVPAWDTYESVILISSSTGASFTYPVLQSLMSRTHRGSVRRIILLLIAQHDGQISWYTQRLDGFAAAARRLGIELQLRVAITQQPDSRTESQLGSDANSLSSAASSTRKATVPITREFVQDTEKGLLEEVPQAPVDDAAYTTTYGRPSLAETIRRPVERSGGETVVAVCGGQELVTATRNCVAQLSDERAVHKGTGAQGIRLHVEEFET